MIVGKSGGFRPSAITAEAEAKAMMDLLTRSKVSGSFDSVCIPEMLWLNATYSFELIAIMIVASERSALSSWHALTVSRRLKNLCVRVSRTRQATSHRLHSNYPCPPSIKRLADPRSILHEASWRSRRERRFRFVMR